MSVHKIYYKDGAKMMSPVLTETEYRNLRNSVKQKTVMKAIRGGDESQKTRLLQMNYSCLPNDDGSLKGTTRMSTTVGMDIDHIADNELEAVKETILAKATELGLLMLEGSARGKGYHLVFRRRPELTQEENLKWASELLGVPYDEGAKDITRVFFTTTEKELYFLDPEIFKIEEAPSNSPKGESCKAKVSTPLPIGEGTEVGLSFKGIPYTSIITEYWSRTGGEPIEGERNVKLYQLAVNLRAICDNKKEVLLAVMPRLGLDEQEFRSIIDSACKEVP